MGLYNKLNSGFSHAVEGLKTGLEAEAGAAESSLGGWLELYSRGADQEVAMLLRCAALVISLVIVDLMITQTDVSDG